MVQNRSQSFMNSDLCNREYALNNDYIIMSDKKYSVYFDESCKHIIIKDTTDGKPYIFDFELKVMKDDIIRVC